MSKATGLSQKVKRFMTHCLIHPRKPANRALLAVCLVTILVAPPVGASGIETAIESQKPAKIQMTWTPRIAARGKAADAKSGIVYYSPAAIGEEHTVFSSTPMMEQSAKSPFVRVLLKERKEFQAEFGLQEKVHAIVVTDWYGNLIGIHQVKDPKGKLSQPLILGQIVNAAKFLKKLEKSSKRDFDKGSKAFDKKQWAKAIKSFLPVAKLKGIDVGEQARDRIAEILELGRSRLKEAVDLGAEDSAAATKALKAIAKEFKGCEVETEATAAAKKLKG